MFEARSELLKEKPPLEKIPKFIKRAQPEQELLRDRKSNVISSYLKYKNN